MIPKKVFLIYLLIPLWIIQSEKRNEELVFKDVPLGSICLILEKKFNVKFVIKKTSLQRKKITGDFSSLSLDQIMEDITYLLNIRYEKKGDTIIIRE